LCIRGGDPNQTALESIYECPDPWNCGKDVGLE